MTDRIGDALARIRAWGEARDWRGWDPYDALNSPAAPLLTLGRRTGRRLLTQAVKRSPLNLRPLLGIRPDWNAKAIALVGSGYARLAAAGDESARPEAERWLGWLVENHSGDEAGLAWGYHFDVQTRFFSYRRGSPNTIATSFAIQALLEGVELLGEDRWAEPARSASRYLEERMLTNGASGDYFRYLPGEGELVHNANLLACAALSRAGLVDPVRRALPASLRAQREDGSWPYADGPGGDWVDNFHTGYVLESLWRCLGLGVEVGGPLERGIDYWQEALFLPDGTPKYFPDRLYPIDAHCYATAIETWLALVDLRTDALARAERLAGLLVQRMLEPSGFVAFQQRRLWTSRVPFVRWSTAPSYRALAGLLLARSRAWTEERAAARLD